MDCNICEYHEFCREAMSSRSCEEIRRKLQNRNVCTLKEFCDLAIKSERGYEKCCRWCGKDFVSDDFDALFCSKRCIERYLNQNKDKKQKEKLDQCLNCGEPLMFGDKFCSRACRAEYEYHKERKEKC